MKIGDYLKAHGLDEDAFAAKSDGEFSAEAVRKWRFGARIPRPRHMATLARLTAGSVTANDFHASSEPVEPVRPAHEPAEVDA